MIHHAPMTSQKRRQLTASETRSGSYRDLRTIIDDLEHQGNETKLRALWLVATALDTHTS